MPKTRTEFWTTKFKANRDRDERKLTDLTRIGWQSMTVWECECDDEERLINQIVRFLEGVPT